MRKVPVLILILVLVIAPALPQAVEPTTTVESNALPDDIPDELMDEIEAPESSPEEGVELSMMFFTETASAENGLYYVCRRGTDALAYFGVSIVKYLSGGTVFTLEFPGSRSVIPEGELPTGSTTNYLYGNDASKWKTGVQDCSVLRYPEIYPGIDLVYKIQNGNLKYEFVVSPHADPDIIRLDYVDAESIELDDDVAVAVRHGQKISDSGLQVFQKNGQIRVGCQFSMYIGRYVGFNLDDYDRSKQLIIDPVWVPYSTFLGGASTDTGESIAVEGAYIYITGSTVSAGFPTISAYDESYNGNRDCFVTKLASDGQSLVYSTFLGGSDREYGLSIAVEDGYAYVTGYTLSSDYPVANGYDSTLNGSFDCFVTKLATDGQSLVYSTFLGGSNDDVGEGISVEDGIAHVIGNTRSTDFPLVNAYNSTSSLYYDCFVAKFAGDGQSLLYSTFLGGKVGSYGYAITVDSGYPYITGSTSSTDFPMVNAYDSTHNGFDDCFVTKLASDGQSLVYSTFVGGNHDDDGYAIAVEDGYAFVTGITTSTDFPVLNAYDSTHNGYEDCFVTKLATDGQSLVYSTYLGGGSLDYGFSIAVEDGYAFVTGETRSTDFPVVNAYDSTLDGDGGCFVTKVAPDGRFLVYSTFLGGSSADVGYGIAVEDGIAFVTGYTSSADFPVANAYDSTLGGGSDCFVSILVDQDTDSDGITDWEEDLLYGTYPYSFDSDNDNYHDGYEIEYGTDPLDPDHYPDMHFDLQYSSYLGGSADDLGQSVVVEGGYVYVAGKTYSSGFPTVSALDSTFNGISDAFIVKLSFDCRTLVYSTFIGGGSTDSAMDLVVESGCVYLTGSTTSSDFPTAYAYDSSYNGLYDCFVAKLAADGQSLNFSTFIGGWDNDYGRGIAIDEGCAYVTGYTQSDDFPIANAYDSTLGGDRDCFVVKLTADGQYLSYSTYLGGSSEEYSYGVAVALGAAYVTGRTYSSDFPTVNAYDATHDGNWECFVTKLAADGQSLTYSTFLGGSGSDRGYSIAVEEGCAIVTGDTQSSTFPTVNAYDSTYNGGLADCFVTKLAADGQSLLYSTFLGGSGGDYGYSVVIEDGYAYITGRTDSPDYPRSFSGEPGLGYDCFVTKVSKGGNILIYSTSLGGEGTDQGMGIAVANGTAYVTGYTDSSALPTELALDPSYNGDWDAFILVTGLDSDRDGLCNLWENMIGSDPYWVDSDYDNFLDYYEFAYGSNATNPSDYPAMPQAWYDAIYEDLDGNATLIQNLITWSDGNATLLETVMLQLDQNATLLQTVISWLDGNHSAIETLFTHVAGNATLLTNTVYNLEGNASLIQNLLDWSADNATLLLSVVGQLESNATLLQQVASWLDGNHTAIEVLLTYVEGNATLLLNTIDSLQNNVDELAVIAALATSNYDWLNSLNATLIGNLTEIREIMDMLGATVGDADYDGLDDLDELDLGTDLQCIDTDCDNLNDAFEVK
ncbi:hypothetical protein EU538_11165, partial [Candidatus Thorarchaeota archaeon]